MAERVPGYWLSLKGRTIPTAEHGSTVMEKPQLFGLNKGQVDKILGGEPYRFSDTGKDSGRGRLLIAAMKNGWVRIRGGGLNISVQYWGNGTKAMKRAYRYLEEEAGPYSNISISDLASGFSTSVPFKDLEDAIQDGMFDVGETETEETAAVDDQTQKDGIQVPRDATRDTSVRAGIRQRLERSIGPSAVQEALLDKWCGWKGGLLVEGMITYQGLAVTDPIISRDIRG